MPPKLSHLSTASQQAIRSHLRIGRDAPLVLPHLDQVDIVLILDRHAPLFDTDIELLVGHPITRVPSAEETDPCDIDNWRITEADEDHSRRFKPGTAVRQLLSHGHTYEELDLLQSQGHVRLAPPPLRVTGSIDELSEWWDDYLRRHPDRHCVDNWKVAEVHPPEVPALRLVASGIRVGATVQQLMVRGLSWALLDNWQREGWLRLAPQPT